MNYTFISNYVMIITIKEGEPMIDKSQIVKKIKTIFYLTYAILLAFVVFNYEKLFFAILSRYS